MFEQYLYMSMRKDWNLLSTRCNQVAHMPEPTLTNQHHIALCDHPNTASAIQRYILGNVYFAASKVDGSNSLNSIDRGNNLLVGDGKPHEGWLDSVEVENVQYCGTHQQFCPDHPVNQLDASIRDECNIGIVVKSTGTPRGRDHMGAWLPKFARSWRFVKSTTHAHPAAQEISSAPFSCYSTKYNSLSESSEIGGIDGESRIGDEDIWFTVVIQPQDKVTQIRFRNFINWKVLCKTM